ncbi:MAG TPA: nickel pincer cofactor biosynthesis protein LarB [Polyangiaceae bacterium]|nr:nickel pincer cofactor biosynthesis protein LarB [Polyangiaceae bacterium]
MGCLIGWRASECYALREEAMDPRRLRELLEGVRSGGTSIDVALAELRNLPYADLGYAAVDHHRALRQGAPEVVFGEGKTALQIVGIARELAGAGHNVLVTRLDPERAREVSAAVPGMRYEELARTATLEVSPVPALTTRTVALISAGTGDLPVAEECAETLRMLGVPVERVYDVGVAGIHRLLHKRDVLDRTGIAIVVAGMEGALPSVVGGIVAGPVIAVPTSIGYGISFGGLAALAGMLSSCAAGVLVCNIDNGFGAACAAARIIRARDRI